MRFKLLTQAKFLARKFEPMDMSRALDLVYLLGNDQDIVYYQHKAYSICELCCIVPSEYSITYFYDLWFHGGPPDQREWFQGTLYQFIIDRLMQALVETSPHAVIQKLGLTKKT